MSASAGLTGYEIVQESCLGCVVISCSFFSVAADVGDTGAEFDRVFLQELRDLKVFVNDREIVEEHRRFLKTNFAF